MTLYQLHTRLFIFGSGGLKKKWAESDDLFGRDSGQEHQVTLLLLSVVAATVLLLVLVVAVAH
jgi:hypothetical protein